MAYSAITPVASGDIVRIALLNKLYDNMVNVGQPAQSVSLNSVPTLLRNHKHITITSFTYVDISAEFSLSIYSSGRRLMIRAPLVTLASSVTANAASYEIVTLLDGVIDTASNMKASMAASTSVFSNSLVYTYITPVQTVGLHTVKLQAKWLTGTSPSLGFYYQPSQKMIVRDY